MKRLQYEDMMNIWNSYHPEDKIFKNSGYAIHHIDENPLNNDISNLKKMTRGEHAILHATGRTFFLTEEQKNNMSIKRKGKNNPFYGKKHSEETKKHWSEIRKGRKATEETKQKLSKALKNRTFSAETIRKMSEAAKKRFKNKENHPWLGKHLSEEAKEKISKANKGKTAWNKGLKIDKKNSTNSKSQRKK